MVVNFSPLDATRELKFKTADAGVSVLVTLALDVLYPNVAPLVGQGTLRTCIVGGLDDYLPLPRNLLFKLLGRKRIARVPRDGAHMAFADLLRGGGEALAIAVDPERDLACLQYTGGTTGTPKGAMLTHQNLSAAARIYAEWSGGDQPVLREGEERCLTVLPLFHIFGLSAVMLRSMLAGTLLVLHPRFDVDKVVQDLGKKRITVFAGVPTMYTALLNHPRLRQTDLSALRYCGSGGAPLPLEVMDGFEGLAKVPLIEGWGMTETAPAGTTQPVRGERRRGSCGLPLPRMNLRVVDVDDPARILGPGEKGEICVSGPTLMRGYWNQPEATAEVLRDGWLHTGDIGTLDADGYLYLVDRKKDMILSGGFNVYPRTIEEAVYEHPAVAEVSVIGIPDAYRGQAAKAFVKLKPDAVPFTLDELRAFLADKIGRHELPTALEFRADLPKTPVGKLSKKELYAEEAARRGQAA